MDQLLKITSEIDHEPLGVSTNISTSNSIFCFPHQELNQKLMRLASWLFHHNWLAWPLLFDCFTSHWLYKIMGSLYKDDGNAVGLLLSRLHLYIYIYVERVWVSKWQLFIAFAAFLINQQANSKTSNISMLMILLQHQASLDALTAGLKGYSCKSWKGTNSA